jgi:NAD-dependent oxidoreductase involved in siderophore biosynthesis
MVPAPNPSAQCSGSRSFAILSNLTNPLYSVACAAPTVRLALHLRGDSEIITRVGQNHKYIIIRLVLVRSDGTVQLGRYGPLKYGVIAYFGDRSLPSRR